MKELVINCSTHSSQATGISILYRPKWGGLTASDLWDLDQDCGGLTALDLWDLDQDLDGEF